ncbi:MAG: tryptophan-rich sensory protein [archaeon]
MPAPKNPQKGKNAPQKKGSILAQGVFGLALSILICLAAGLIGGIFTASSVGSWYISLNKPDFTPPSWVFGPVWTILYVLMGISLHLAIKRGANKKALLIFCVQLILNILWSFCFFGLRSPALALFCIFLLWLAILFSILEFRKFSRIAAYLLIPYIVWVSFAGALNFAIVQMPTPSGTAIATTTTIPAGPEMAKTTNPTSSIQSTISNVPYDPTQYVWVANLGTNAITKLYASNGSKAFSRFFGLGLEAIAVDASGNVWIPSRAENRIIKLNGETGATIGTYPVGQRPEGVAVDASGNVWVTNLESNTVTKLNGETGATIGTYPVGSEPFGIAIDSSGNVWVASSGSDTVTKLNGATGENISEYWVGGDPACIAISPSGDVWVTASASASVTKLSSSGVPVASYPTGYSPIGIAIDSLGNVWVASSGSDTVTKLNGETGGEIGTYSVGTSPLGISVDFSGNIWVANRGGDTVTKLNGETGEKLGDYSVGDGPSGIGDMTGFVLRHFVLKND